MTKYKSGTITVNISNAVAWNLNNLNYSVISADDIISHDPAPEPIVKFGFVLGHGGIEDNFITLEGAKMASSGYKGVVGYFKTTITGNDFTVEKVTE